LSASQARQPKGLSVAGDGRKPAPSSGWTGTIVRVLFGVIFAIDAALKWLPGYRNDEGEKYISDHFTSA
jgi:hypothetical protein